MAFPTSVNDQITDSVTQSNVAVVGESPAVALSNLYQATAHSIGLLLENAVAAQQQAAITAQAATTQSIRVLYSLEAAPEFGPPPGNGDKPVTP